MANRRAGISEMMVLNIVHIIMLIFLLLFFRFFISQYYDSSINTQKLDLDLLHRRLLSNPSLFVPHAMPGTVNEQLFVDQQEDVLLQHFYYGSFTQLIAARLWLRDEDTAKEYDLYLNKDAYVLWSPLAEADLNRGKGGITRMVQWYPVQIQTSGGLHKGYLTITILIPNS